MKKAATIIILVLMLIASMGRVYAACWHDPVVKEWLKERDDYALQTVRAWLSSKPNKTVLNSTAQVWILETHIATHCRKDPLFLKKNLLLFKDKYPFRVTVEVVPPMLFQELSGRDILMPFNQYYGGDIDDNKKY